MELFIYSDETVFDFCDQRGKFEAVGSGTLVTTKPISKHLISSALVELGKDPDIEDVKTKKQDYRTLKDKFFHASVDSKNAHSHLCRSIVKNVQGNFSYCVYNKINNLILTENSRLEKIIKFTTSFSAIQIFNEGQKVEKVNWFIEGRSELTQSAMSKWIEKWFRMYEDLFSFHLTAIPQYYPKLELFIEDKNNPGLQVLDFILWATNRKYGCIKNSTWFDRLKLTLENEDFENSNLIHFGNFYLSKKVKFNNTKPYPVDARFLGGITSFAAIFHLYRFIELKLKKIAFEGLPSHCSHFNENLQKITNRTNDMRIDLTEEDLLKQASLFIRLFDTLPIYKGFPVNEYIDWNWANLLFAKKLAGFIIKDIDMAKPLEDIKKIILDWRKLVKQNNPEFFNIENLRNFEKK
ncbi:MAG: DUF3800 domain-containing protein [Bacteroidetes bacterium]|nr:DUF3800 domain-containing protein [Bacteroidota bacterium]